MGTAGSSMPDRSAGQSVIAGYQRRRDRVSVCLPASNQRYLRSGFFDVPIDADAGPQTGGAELPQHGAQWGRISTCSTARQFAIVHGQSGNVVAVRIVSEPRRIPRQRARGFETPDDLGDGDDAESERRAATAGMAPHL